MCNETNKIKHKFIFEKCIIGALLLSALGILFLPFSCKKEDTAQPPLTKKIKCEYRDNSGVHNTFTIKVPIDTELTNGVLCRAAFHSFMQKDTTK